jgi:peptide/nickel transport system ATP-binding protein
VPELADLPNGCAFAERCTLAIDDCRRGPPPPVAVGPAHAARCIRLEARP